MRKVWQILGFVLVLVILTGLGTYAFMPRTQLLSYFAPEISFVRISNLLVKDNQASWQLHLSANAPLLPVQINSLQYTLSLYNKRLAQGNQPVTTQPRNKMQPIILTGNLNYTQALPAIQHQLQDNQPVNAGFKMQCQIPFIGKCSINTQEVLPFSIPVLVAPQITNLATEEIGFQHLQVVFTVQVANPNKFDCYLRHLSVKAQFPEYLAVANNIREDYLIKANQVIPIKIYSAKAITKTNKDILFQVSSTLTYNLQTAMLLEPVNAPVDQINFQATRAGSVTVAQKI
ncbi:hypothetical protein [Adhaeribacter pallidiroseus]|nr:hypothetical protein [Adhaeribacter pallidiroseus]